VPGRSTSCTTPGRRAQASRGAVGEHLHTVSNPTTSDARHSRNPPWAVRDRRSPRCGLDGHLAPKRRVARAIDLAHPAADRHGVQPQLRALAGAGRRGRGGPREARGRRAKPVARVVRSGPAGGLARLHRSERPRRYLPDAPGRSEPRAAAVLDVATGRARVIEVPAPRYHFGSAVSGWLPDSRRFLFASGGNLAVVDAKAGTWTPLPVPLSEGSRYRLTANARSLLMERSVLDADIWLMEIK
jgi:hypothetical protein